MDQHIVTPGGEKIYLFDIANRLKEDPAVKDALACILETENSPLVAHVVLEDSIQETEKEVLRRLDSIMSDFLPAELRIEGYHLDHGQLRFNMVGKTDWDYYKHLLTGYFDGGQHAIQF